MSQLLRTWADIALAIGANPQRLIREGFEGVLCFAWKLPLCPRITTRRVWRNRSESLAFPFTIDQLQTFLKEKTVALIIDTETNGREGEECEVIELGYAGVDLQLKQAPALAKNATLCARFEPIRRSIPAALATHRILSAALEGCPPSCEAKPTLLREPYFASGYIVGHNVDFDVQALGLPEDHVKLIDTMAIARKLWPGLDSYKLTALMFELFPEQEAFSITQNAHGALEDVAMVFRLLRKGWEAVPSEFSSDAALWHFSELCRVPEFMPFGKHKGEKIEQLPAGYVDWALKNCENLDKYLRKALQARWDEAYLAQDVAPAPEARS